jgi:hypothetical protein
MAPYFPKVILNLRSSDIFLKNMIKLNAQYFRQKKNTTFFSFQTVQNMLMQYASKTLLLKKLRYN